MKLQKHPTFLPRGASYRVVPDASIITGPFYYTKREALIHWLEGVAVELSRGKCSEEEVIKVLQLQEIESSEL